MIYGRERERAQLRELLDDAIAGYGSLVLISGEAGIGKTTLVDDLIHEAGERGCLVLTGGCYDLTTTPPYGPWVEVLRGYSPNDRGPDLPAWFDNPGQLDQVGSQAALFEDTRAFFAGVAAMQPLVIVLEDLHWSDPASLDALRYLARQMLDDAVLILATYRDDEITRRHTLFQILPALVRESHAQRLSLRPLDREAIRSSIESNYRLPASDRDTLVDYLARLSDGNPFFIGELLYTLEDDGQLYRTDAGWQLRSIETVRVPTLVSQMIESRLQRLGTGTRRHLEVAAIIGQRIDLSTWQAVLEISDIELNAALASAIDAHILTASNESTRVEFTHALAREVVYDEIVPIVRRQIHQHVGEYLLDRANPDPDRVAHHLVQAGDARAPDWLIKAGARAERSYAWFTGASHYEVAQEMLKSDPERRRQRGWLLLRISRVRRYGDLLGTLPYVEEAHRIALEIGDDLLAAACQFQIGLLHFISGTAIRRGIDETIRGATALEHISRRENQPLPGLVRAAAGPDLPLDAPDAPLLSGETPKDRVGLAGPRGTAAVYLAVVGRFDEAREMAMEFIHRAGVDLSDPNDPRHIVVRDAYRCLALVHWAVGHPDDARSLIDIDFRVQLQLGNFAIATLLKTRFLLYYALRYEADQPRRWSGLLEEALPIFKRASGAQVKIEDEIAGSHWHDFHVGKWKQTDASARTIRSERGNNVTVGPDAATVLALVARHLGRHDESWSWIKAVLPEMTETEPGGHEFWSALTLIQIAAELYLDAGELDQARTWIDAYHHWLDWSGAVLGKAEGQLTDARHQRLSGDLVAARKHAERALGHASNPRQPLALIAIDRFLGQLDVDQGNHDEAMVHLDASLDLAGRCEAPFEQALTLVVMAERSVKLGEADEARPLIRRAREICEPLGAKPTLDRIDEIEAMLPRMRRSTGEHLFGLTDREIDVLRLVAQGRTDAEAAEELFISPRTASQHLRNIYNKLGVNNRAEATRVAVEQGMV